ncbi:hypothetical protein [uncultured Fibrella sp.]|uniref:hypothetical protein n=1 Tax=uncultured Fibrella sp. TaxID=1284596 RepID=UPI0035C9BE70
MPQSVKDRVSQFRYNIGQGHFDSWIQYIQNAAGSQVNCDYFPIKIDRLPNGFFSPEQFIEYFRMSINNFSPKKFYPHPSISGEANKWQNEPLGSIISIEIDPMDYGSVTVIDKQNMDWTFATIHDPFKPNHLASIHLMCKWIFGIIKKGFEYTIPTQIIQ